MENDLKQWIEQQTQATIVHCERQGRGREAWFVTTDVFIAGKAQNEIKRFYLRCGRGGHGAIAEIYTIAREAQVLAALNRTQIPVPKVIGFYPEKPAVLLSHVEGCADFHKIDSTDQREKIADQFMQELAQLHNFSADELRITFLPIPVTPQQFALDDLAIWQKSYTQAVRETDPAIDFALQWLNSEVPQPTGKLSLLQGDTGPGQFLFNAEKITAIVDWEFCHWGDPMEDLAMIRARDLVTPFGDLRQRFARYSELSGIALNMPALKYYSVRAMLNTPLGLIGVVQNPHHKADMAEYLSWHLLYKRATMEVLAEALGVKLQQSHFPEAQQSSYSSLYEVMLTNLSKEHLPTIVDSYQAYRLSGMIRLAKYLQNVEKYRADMDRIEIAEIAKLTGKYFASRLEADQALNDLIQNNWRAFQYQLVEYLFHRSAREEFLLKPAMGEMATSVVAPIDY